MKRTFIIILSIFLGFLYSSAKVLTSPNKSCKAMFEQGDSILILRVLKDNNLVGKLSFGLRTDIYDDNFGSIKPIKREKFNQAKNFRAYRIVSAKSDLQIQIRLFDNAIAFRYIDEKNTNVHVWEEYSSWNIPEKTKIWYFERKNDWKLKSYAGTWENCDISALDTISPNSSVQGKPLILEYVEGYKGFISEVNLLNYSGMRLDAIGNNTVKANFTEGKKGFTVYGQFSTPWRILFFGKDLNKLVNQQIIKELSNKPNSTLFSDTSYILPGKSVWRWFSSGTGSFEEERAYIKYASQLNFSYSIIDEGWEDWNDAWENLSEIVNYGKTLGVKVFVWKHSNQLMNPENDYEEMKLFLDKLVNIGIVGVKVDFMNSESYPTIKFDIKLLEECAKRKLLVDLHGCQSPSGENFTFPNELTREGIRGMEVNKMKEGYLPAYHNTALPFTRFVVGPGDYTPLSFVTPGETTFAHQLATLICFNSPLQVIAEDPEILLNDTLISKALDFFRDVPTVWDETMVLPQSKIGKLAIIARRFKNEWFIGVLNGENKSKQIIIDLSFIKDKSETILFVDDLNAKRVLINDEGYRPVLLKREPSIPFKRINKTNLPDEVSLHLAPNGGAVIWIK